MLQKMEYRHIDEAEDGKEAWTKMQAEEYDLVIADWIMPKMEGIDLLRKARRSEKFQDLPFLMVTGVVEEATVAEAAETDADAYIIKPFVAKTLEKKVDEILDRYLNPDELEILLSLGSEHMRAGAYEAALREFKRALSISPEKATEPLRKAIKISPRNTDRHLRLGKLFLELGEVAKARDVLSAAMKVANKDAHVRAEIGELLLGHEMAEEAAAAFEGALKIDPRNVHFYNRLGIAYRKQGKYVVAIEQYKRALKVAPNDENIYYNLGRALLEAKRDKDARTAFESALKLNPNFPEVKEILATL
jgi:tetratricopeptide (TPR) repeat protein